MTCVSCSRKYSYVYVCNVRRQLTRDDSNFKGVCVFAAVLFDIVLLYYSSFWVFFISIFRKKILYWLEPERVRVWKFIFIGSTCGCFACGLFFHLRCNLSTRLWWSKVKANTCLFVRGLGESLSNIRYLHAVHSSAHENRNVDVYLLAICYVFHV